MNSGDNCLDIYRYRRVENFIAMAYLIAGKLTHLPASPFAPFLPVPHETT